LPDEHRELQVGMIANQWLRLLSHAMDTVGHDIAMEQKLMQMSDVSSNPPLRGRQRVSPTSPAIAQTTPRVKAIAFDGFVIFNSGPSRHLDFAKVNSS
jgi:hypothetical protein